MAERVQLRFCWYPSAFDHIPDIHRRANSDIESAIRQLCNLDRTLDNRHRVMTYRNRHHTRQGIHARQFTRRNPGTQKFFEAMDLGKPGSRRSLCIGFISSHRCNLHQRAHLHLGSRNNGWFLGRGYPCTPAEGGTQQYEKGCLDTK